MRKKFDVDSLDILNEILPRLYDQSILYLQILKSIHFLCCVIVSILCIPFFNVDISVREPWGLIVAKRSNNCITTWLRKFFPQNV